MGGGGTQVTSLLKRGVVSGVCSLVLAYEVLRYREHRVRVRHPEFAG